MTWLTRAADGPPLIIAHAAGNNLGRLESAISAGAEMAETDIYAQRDHFEIRHERSLHPFPLWVERWYARPRPRQPLRLLDLMRIAADRCAILLDVKHGGRHPAQLLKRSLAVGDVPVRVAVSSQFWYILRDIVKLHEDVPALYSIDVEAKLELFLSVMDRDLPAGVSVRHTLLDEGVIRRLKDAGLFIAAWTVDDTDRALDLANLGVDAITTNLPAEMKPLFGSP